MRVAIIPDFDFLKNLEDINVEIPEITVKKK
jgi:hypothetical protein